MKQGANFSDVRDIKRLAEAGKSAEYVSKALNIALSCVQSFMVDGATEIKVAKPDSDLAKVNPFMGPPKIGS